MPPDFTAWEPYLLGLVFAGLVFLGVGFFAKGPRSNVLRIVGWILFALYWPFQAPQYFFAEEADPINGWFTLLGPLFLLYIAWHERLSLKWGEDPPALRWFAGASFVSAATYFIIYKIPAVTKWLIHVTAVQSAWMLELLFRVPSEVRVRGEDSDILIHGGDYAVTVILACTAVQSMMIFVGAIFSLTNAPWNRKTKALLCSVPIIYVLNLFRNAGIVYGYKILDWRMFGIESFEWMHSYVGKIGSLLALIVIALAVFRTLPELHNNILDLFDLRKRRKPGFFAPPPASAPAPGPKAPPASPTDAK